MLKGLKEKEIVLLGSGQGSTIRAICNAVKYKILNVNISCILANKETNILTIAEEFNIPYINSIWNKDKYSRNEYESIITEELKTYSPDLVVLAGWNFIVSEKFISSFKKVINLHPALPNTFVGQNCIKKAYHAFQKGEIKYTGSMVHEVVPEVDKGNVLTYIKIPIFTNDTYETLESRVKNSEKGIMIQSIQSLINSYNENFINQSSKIYNGKVRRVEDIGHGLLLLSASNRLSAFNRYICEINNKGAMLNSMSSWWFENTKDIIDNHLIYSINEHMIVKKTTPILLEIIVRGYMTGESETSIWNMYKKGSRQMYGIDFRDGYQKNEKLDNIIITITTKGIKDIPITYIEIIEQGYLTLEEYDYIVHSALKLFNYGQNVASKKGFILVDTKYEFGRLYNGKIILIDELHTCDSSRFWLQKSYQERFKKGLEPEKLDKDCVRDWIKSHCDPYTDIIPDVPDSIKNKVKEVYLIYTQKLTGK